MEVVERCGKSPLRLEPKWQRTHQRDDDDDIDKDVDMIVIVMS